MKRSFLIALLPLLLAAACSTGPERGSSGGEQVHGAVVAVNGDLARVRSFDILTEDGVRLTLQPADGLLFADAEPIAHLRDHMTSGHPVVVRYEEEGDRLIATYAGDTE